MRLDGVGVGIRLKVGWGGVGDEGVGLRDFYDFCFQFFHWQVNIDYLEFLNYLVDSKWWSAGRSRGRTEEVNKERLTKIKKKTTHVKPRKTSQPMTSNCTRSGVTPCRCLD